MQKLSGFLILISFITTLYSYFIDATYLIASSLVLWFSALLLFSSLKNKNVVLILMFLSLMFFGFSYINGFHINIDKAFSINQYLIILLIGVGFLRLIIDPKKDNSNHSSRGKSGFLKTYLSLHLFGSMINISALLIMADRLYKKTGKLSNLQVILLSRAFSTDAYWSPFFVAFGVAITFAPKLELIYVTSSGIALAFISFIITYFEVKDRADLKEFEGYPLNLQSLVLPFSLAFFVVLIHYFYKDIKIIVLIAILAFALSLVVLPIKDGFKKAINKYKKHINEDLPNMKNEISLFLAAGMFGVSVSSILYGVGFTLPFDHYDYKIASIVLLLFIVLSFIGIHPIITISIFGHMLAHFDQSLVAITFLMAWGMTVSTSPFSGQTITIHARYKVDIKELVKSNFAFLIKIYIFCIFILYFLSEILNLK